MVEWEDEEGEDADDELESSGESLSSRMISSSGGSSGWEED